MLHSPLIATLALMTLAACAGTAPAPVAPAPDLAVRQALLDCATTAVARAGFEIRRRPTAPAYAVEGRRLLGDGEPGTAIELLEVGVAARHDSLVVAAAGRTGEIVDRRGSYVERLPSTTVRAAAAEVMAACPAQPARGAA